MDIKDAFDNVGKNTFNNGKSGHDYSVELGLNDDALRAGMKHFIMTYIPGGHFMLSEILRGDPMATNSLQNLGCGFLAGVVWARENPLIEE